MSALDASVARARGLGTHLLSAPEWEELRASIDLGAVSERLRTGRDPLAVAGAESVLPEALEAAVRRRAGARLQLLARWCAGMPELLAVLFGEEDRRNLRLLLHGAVQGAAPADRLRGTLPTPTLPSGALATLAGQTTIQGMAALLAVWRHPDAAVLASRRAPGPPDLLLLDTELTRAWALRAVAAARRVDAELQRTVAETIDLENVLTAIVLAGCAGERPDLQPAPGGQLGVDEVRAIADAGSSTAAMERAREAFAGSDLEAAFVGPGGAPGARARASRVALALARDRARRAPLSSAPVVAYVVGLRKEVQDLQRLVWAMALGAPASERRGEH